MNERMREELEARVEALEEELAQATAERDHWRDEALHMAYRAAPYLLDKLREYESS